MSFGFSENIVKAGQIKDLLIQLLFPSLFQVLFFCFDHINFLDVYHNLRKNG